jgi:hypothetical protein
MISFARRRLARADHKYHAISSSALATTLAARTTIVALDAPGFGVDVIGGRVAAAIIAVLRGFAVRQIFAIVMVLSLAGLLAAQGTPRRPQPVSTQTTQNRDPQFERNRNQQPTPLEIEWEKKRLKAMNEERHQSLQRDTDELLKLSTELKEYVDKTNENMMSVEVIKKAEEIEKLAKKVRNKMKGY